MFTPCDVYIWLESRAEIIDNERFVSHGFCHCARPSLRFSGTRRFVICFARCPHALGPGPKTRKQQFPSSHGRGPSGPEPSGRESARPAAVRRRGRDSRHCTSRWRRQRASRLPARDRLGEISRQSAGPTCKDCTAHAASSAGYSAHFAFSNVRSS